MKLKLSYNGDVHRLQTVPQTYESLQQEIVRTFDLKGQCDVKYIDDEDDRITIGSTIELQDAIRFAEEQNSNLKLFVTPLPGVANQVPKAPAKAPAKKADAPAKPVAKPAAAEAKTAEAKTAEEVRPNPFESRENNFLKLRDLAGDFIQSKEIREELPDALQVFLSGLSDPATSVEEAIQNVLGLFPHIAAHPFAQSVVQFAPLMEQWRPLLPLFLQAQGPNSADGLVRMMTQYLDNVPSSGNVASNPLASIFGAQRGGRGAGGFTHPLAGLFGAQPVVNDHRVGDQPSDQPATDAEAKADDVSDADSDESDDSSDDSQVEEEEGKGGDAKENEEEAASSGPPLTVHMHVACDGCGESPIVGVCFKCVDCRDFDLCATCEAHPDLQKFKKLGHAIEHMMVKYKKEAEDTLRFRRFGARGNGGRCGGHRGGRGRRQGGPVGHRGHGPRGPRGHARGRGRRGCGDKPKKTRRFGAEVTDVTLPRGSIHCVRPEDELVKVWSVKNTGEQEWPKGTALVFCKGAEIGPAEVLVPKACAPGDQLELSLPVKAPRAPGKYFARYRLKLPESAREAREADHAGTRGGTRRHLKFGRPFRVVFVVKEEEREEVTEKKSVVVDIPVTTPVVDIPVTTPVVDVPVVTPVVDKVVTPVVDKEDYVVVQSPAAAAEEEESEELKSFDGPEKDAEKTPAAPATPVPNAKYSSQLNLLRSMGFPHEDLNLWVIEKHNGSVEKAALQLIKLSA